MDQFAQDCPEHTAIESGDTTVSYKELSQMVASTARSVHLTGVQPGERVALLATKTIASIVLILGTLRVGAVVVPVNPLLKQRQLANIIDHSDAKLLLCSKTRYNDLLSEPTSLKSLHTVVLTDEHLSTSLPHEKHTTEYSKNLIVWNDFIRLGENDESLHFAEIQDNGLGAILYTSGSTGSPKGVMLTRSNLQYGAISVSSYLENTSDDRILALMPLSFDYGLSQLTTAIHSGACLVLHDYFLPKKLLETAAKHRVTGIPAVPHLWDNLVAVEWPVLPDLRYVTSTGGRLQEPTIRAMKERLCKVKIYSMYGFTEAFRATYLNPDDINKRPTSIGKAVPYADVLVVNAEGIENPPFETGEIIQAGPLVTAGYWKDPNETNRIFRQNSNIKSTNIDARIAWSGDLGYTDNEGYLYFVSRSDDQVKLNGHRASPTEIESTLIQCQWIIELCVICAPHSSFGNIAIAYAVVQKAITEEDLTHWARQNLPNYMVPLHWYLLSELPTTPNNKIDRKTLLNTYLNGIDVEPDQAMNG